MRIDLESQDIQQITERVVEALKPYLAGVTRPPEEDTIFDVQELCGYLKVTRKWVHERTHFKEIPYYKLSNKQLRFRKRDIDKWLLSLKTPAINQFSGKMELLK